MGRTAVLIALIAFIGAACAPGGVTPEFKARRISGDPSVVNLYREPDGTVLDAWVTIDGEIIGSIGPGHKLTLKLTAGVHSVGVTTVTVNCPCASGEVYNFLLYLVPSIVSLGTPPWNIRRLNAEEAASRTASYTDVSERELTKYEWPPRRPGPPR